jgi:hypothetical protein
MGLGAYVHLWFPQAKLGYLRRPDPEPKRRQSFLISVDLYDLFTGLPGDLKAAKAAALTGLKGELP